MDFSRSALDRLGERLRDAEPVSDADREMYDAYRASFADALMEVGRTCNERIDSAVGQSARLKTLDSTTAKLRRGPIRLSQIYDIAGLRFVFEHLADQEQAFRRIAAVFPGSRMIDYRERPQHGYRAVHIIATSDAKFPVEVQIRTRAQDVWANTSEKVAARIGLDVKYGGGPKFVQSALFRASDLWRLWDLRTQSFYELDRNVDQLLQEAERLHASGTEQGRREGKQLRSQAIGTLEKAQEILDEADLISDRARDAVQSLWRRMAEEGLLK